MEQTRVTRREEMEHSELSDSTNVATLQVIEIIFNSPILKI